MKRLAGYPTSFYYWLLILSTVVWLSGTLMIPTMLEFKLGWNVSWRLSGESRLWTVSLHVLGSWILVTLIGALWQVHMRAGWRKKQNRISGAFTAVSFLILMITGVGLYYFSSLEWQINSAIVHTLLGLALLLIIIIHVITGRRIRLS